MHFKPSELQLVPLKDVEPGSLIELPEMRDRFPLFLRIANLGEHPGLLALGGTHSLEVIDWDNPTSVARVICEAANLRIELKDPNDGYDQISTPGSLVLRTGGAYIQAKRNARQAYGSRISTASWAHIGNSSEGDVCCFTEWQFGQLDTSGNFVSIYPK